MEKLSWNVKAHRRLGEKTLASHAFFSDELEGLGKESWDEHKAKRDSGPDAEPVQPGRRSRRSGGVSMSTVISTLVSRLQLGDPVATEGSP